ncbi:putative farnesyltransferase / geranylgeranyltransferase type-1, subunit alpha [Cryptosporidium serpentis]
MEFSDYESIIDNKYVINSNKNEVCLFSIKDEDHKMLTLLKIALEKKEFSKRVFNLTKYIIDFNSQHYTAWYVRRKCIEAMVKELGKEPVDISSLLKSEMSYVHAITYDNPKCYQLWWYRRYILKLIGNDNEDLVYVSCSIQQDAKNISAWAHRVWLIKQFFKDNLDLYTTEINFTSALIRDDCRNNSVWCYRHFIFRLLLGDETRKLDLEEIILEELEFIIYWLERVPHNEALWNYIRVIFNNPQVGQELESKTTYMNLKAIPPFFEEAVNYIYEEHKVTCHQASYFIACLSYARGNISKVQDCLETLEISDPIRRYFWNWKLCNIVTKKISL